MHRSIRIAGLAGLLAAACAQPAGAENDGGQAKIDVNPFRTVTLASYEQFGKYYLPPFNPDLGTLVSAQAATSAQVTYKAVAGKPLAAPLPYDVGGGFTIYAGPVYFDLHVSGAGTLPAGATELAMPASGKGSTAVTGAPLKALVGKSGIPLTFSPSPPTKLPGGVPPASVQTANASGTVAITYRYTLSTRIKPPKVLPKQPLPKL